MYATSETVSTQSGYLYFGNSAFGAEQWRRSPHIATLARRFSGGGAVYHDRGNINLSFIETVKQPDFVYYLQQVVDFLEKVGVSAYADQRLGIYVDERKISGSAQCIHKDRVMYHCTLLFSTDLDTLNAALNGDPDAENRLPGSRTMRAVPSVRSEVANIKEFCLDPMDIKRFMHLPSFTPLWMMTITGFTASLPEIWKPSNG